MTKIQKLDPNTIHLDPNLQPRNELIADAIKTYADDMRNGDEFPPVKIVNVNGRLILTSGWHRTLSARRAGVKIPAIVRTGTMQDAAWEACAANVEHDKSGSRRTNEDKGKAVKMALRAWVEMGKGPINASEIAKHVGVNQQTVRNWADREGIDRPQNDMKVIPNSQKLGIWDNRASEIDHLSEDDAAQYRQELMDRADKERQRREDEKREIEEIQREIKTEDRAQFNRVNSNIEWAMWSWNPVTGCRHDCPYCYARDIANRFYPQGFEPTFYADRLTAPHNTNVPVTPRWRGDIGHRNVFTCSMADLFGKWVPDEWIAAVLQQISDSPQWTFLLLTKFPVRMADFEYPENTWIGTSVDRQWAVDRAEKSFRKIRASGYKGVAWLSCEPMMERLTFTSLEMFDWVVIGGSSKSTQTPAYTPPFRDTAHLVKQADRHGIPIFMKDNLGIEDSARIREYPTT